MVFAECNLFYDENITLSKLKKEKKRKTIVVRWLPRYESVYLLLDCTKVYFIFGLYA